MEITRPKSKQPIPDNAKKVFGGVLFDVYQWEQELFDGTKTTFEKLKRPDTVVVLPVLPDGRIILIEEEQPGAAIYIGPLGGRVDEGEDALEAARRELLEESGYEAREMNLWYARQITTKIDWAVYVFIAKGIQKVAEPALEAGEKIKLFPITLEEFMNGATKISDDSGDSKKVAIKFGEDEITIQFLKAKLDQKKKKELEELFNPL